MSDETPGPESRRRGRGAAVAVGLAAATIAAAGDAAAERAQEAISEQPATDEFPETLIVRPQMREARHEPKALYHLGTLPACPRQNVELGGVAFHRFTKGALIGDTRVEGQRLLLTPSQLRLITAALEKRVVRWIGEGDTQRAEVLTTDTAGFRADDRDEPLAKYLYCERVRDEQIEIEKTPHRTMA